jgi:hypothetical protein
MVNRYWRGTRRNFLWASIVYGNQYCTKHCPTINLWTIIDCKYCDRGLQIHNGTIRSINILIHKWEFSIAVYADTVDIEHYYFLPCPYYWFAVKATHAASPNPISPAIDTIISIINYSKRITHHITVKGLHRPTITVAKRASSFIHLSATVKNHPTVCAIASLPI